MSGGIWQEEGMGALQVWAGVGQSYIGALDYEGTIKPDSALGNLHIPPAIVDAYHTIAS